jgi:hypothetical protein
MWKARVARPQRPKEVPRSGKFLSFPRNAAAQHPQRSPDPSWVECDHNLRAGGRACLRGSAADQVCQIAPLPSYLIHKACQASGTSVAGLETRLSVFKLQRCCTKAPSQDRSDDDRETLKSKGRAVCAHSGQPNPGRPHYSVRGQD